MSQQFRRRTLRPVWAAMVSTLSLLAAAQTPKARLSGPITGDTTALAGSRPPLARLATDAGALPSGTAMKGLTMVFARSAAQEADLASLLAAQQDPTSPQYHQWLTPDNFAARFGVAASDLATTEAWLQGQGFSVDGVNRSRNAITFSGTAGTVGTAFRTEFHQYKLSGETHFAPATDLSLPASLSGIVSAVLHTSDFRPKPHIRPAIGPQAAPAFTSSQTQAHFLTPKDVATMYNVTAEYNAGYTGVGQSIAVMGQSYVQTADIAAFRSAAGLPAATPTLVLVPGTGVAGISAGDETESDLDLEYSGGMAPGATVSLVYVGNNPSYGAFDSLDYAISENIAPVLSISYGGCEPLSAASQLQAYSAMYAQAAAQGQSIFAAAGDEGSEDCFGAQNVSTATADQLAVDFPGSSPYVTSVGGTQMASGTTAAGSTTYWGAASGSDNTSSLLSYVPETVWNETSAAQGILAGGGGASIDFPRPSYQAGVPGIPAGAFRLVPDVSLQASTSNPGYLYCSSDLDSLEGANITASCTSGFRDSSGKYLLVAGGTSFAAPIMAGMTALLNQVTHATGQGLLNPQLYALASSSGTYASAFHDITHGTNACSVASVCPAQQALLYPAGVGYDEATGLGSVNFANLVAAWPSTSNTALAATVTTVAAASTTPGAGAADTITLNVVSATTGAGTPTGTVAISVDGGAATSVPLVSGAASFAYIASTTPGSHVITATYTGDATHAASTSSTSVTITAGTLATGAFSFSVGSLTVPTNSAGTSAVLISPVSGYNGSAVFTLTIPSTAPIICYAMEYGTSGAQTYTVPVAGLTQATLLIGVGATQCGSVTNNPSWRIAKPTVQKASVTPPTSKPSPNVPVLAALAGLLATGFAARRRARRLPMLLTMGLLMAVTLGAVGCGGGGGTGESTSTPVPTSGASYTLTLTGTDSVTSSITSSTNFTLTL